MMQIKDVALLGKQVVGEVERAVVGKHELLVMVMSSILAGGHVLLEDYPGLGKTLIARSFATALGLDFKRIQFNPDLWVMRADGSDLRRLTRGVDSYTPDWSR